MIKKFNEYYSDPIQKFIKSIEKFEITDQEYDSLIIHNNLSTFDLNKKEEEIINIGNIKYDRRGLNNNKVWYSLLVNDDINICLMKASDDYYYILIYQSGYKQYKLDQLPELKYFMKQLNILLNQV